MLYAKLDDFLSFLVYSFQPGGFINSVTFRAIKGKGAEGDIAIDELHFMETCDMEPKGMSFVWQKHFMGIMDNILTQYITFSKRLCWNHWCYYFEAQQDFFPIYIYIYTKHSSDIISDKIR